MNSVREYHNEAIQAAQLAMAALHKGNYATHKQLMQRAMSFETNAADLVPDEKTSEPTRAILYRSAASFAYQAGEYQEAERLIFKGLSGYPPAYVKQQLLEVQQMLHALLPYEQGSEAETKGAEQRIITAIYENGVLHPTTALPLQESQKVALQILPMLEGVTP
jgi:tetratricopeptide (TPR) repeat protein